MVAEMQNGKIHEVFFQHYLGLHRRPAGSENLYAGIHPFVRFHSRPVAVNIRFLRVLLENRADCKMRPDPVKVNAARFDQPDVSLFAVDVFPCVSRRFLKNFFIARLEIIAADFLGKLNRARGVIHYLHRFYPANVVEEPTAARVHQHRVSLHLEKLQNQHLLVV